ncbi:hypothetical protein L3X38_007664 [Prunus dulcis]|uniref:TTF-type domain-containing protein n=1 Tax=Prunus dulcis TaxID=3755 RepID=A0AAD5F699_PRUDU|nr:hypothetical protein L3X38_007664 [Prunus dulcis]
MPEADAHWDKRGWTTPWKAENLAKDSMKALLYAHQVLDESPKPFVKSAAQLCCTLSFDDHDWLEYSIAKDAAYCLHCYLFKSNFDQVGGDAFTGVGFKNWKKAKDRFNLHVGPVGSVHNQAREVAYNLMHQTIHIETIVIKQTSQACTAYRTCLNASLKCTRYLLRQGLSFRGHDESAQSSNKGNYLELLQFLADHDEKVKAVVLENAPGNLKLIAHSILVLKKPLVLS